MDVNPWIGVNYIADGLNVPIPPAHFLAQIYDQDAQLVLLPSKMQPFTYIIARRRRSAPGRIPDDLAKQVPEDTQLCLRYNLVPVCRIYHTGPSWDATAVVASLRARDLWAHGGADKVADVLEAQEDAAKAKIQSDIKDDLYNRSGDAWRSYQARTGQRVLGANPTLQSEPQHILAPSGSMAGSGSVSTE